MSDQLSAISDQLQAAAEAFERPDIVCAIKPKIESIDDAELALREVSWIETREASVRAKADELIGEINELIKKLSTFQQGEESVPLSDRREILEAALLKWGDKNRAKLCPGRKKSVELRNGKFTWRDAKDTVARFDDVAAKDAKAKISEMMVDEVVEVGSQPLAACLQAVIDSLGYHGAISVAVDVNKTAATSAYKNKQINDEDLEAIDHEFKKGEEYITVEPAEFVRAGVNA